MDKKVEAWQLQPFLYVLHLKDLFITIPNALLTAVQGPFCA